MVAPITPRIGLLGGSFNPAHMGHVGISKTAMDTLGLHSVWWLVTPKNPHKDAQQYAPLSWRIAYASAMTHDHNIVVKDVETSLKSNYTLDVVTHLMNTHPTYQFIWMMGGDNFVTFHTWHAWQKISQQVPIAVFSRPNTHEDALQKSPCCDTLIHTDTVNIWNDIPHLWTYIGSTHFPENASDIRKNTTLLT